MSRPRSANYPAIALPQAIEGVRAIHAAEHLSKVDQAVVAKRLGYSGLSGPSMARISALKKYGLLEGSNKELRVTSDALTIIADPVDSPERQAAVRRAAHGPALFHKLFEYYREVIPSEEGVRSYLTKEGFTSTAVGKAAKAFVDTLDLVTHEGGGYDDGVKGETDDDQKKQDQPPRKVPLMEGEREFLRMSLSATTDVRVLVNGPMTPNELKKLGEIISLQRRFLLLDEKEQREVLDDFVAEIDEPPQET